MQKDAPRFVYLIEYNGIHKIGSSVNPAVRLDEVAPGGRLLPFLLIAS